ncbi:MAG: beta-phosphoglucomutase [Saprospiraceae bacterium]
MIKACIFDLDGVIVDTAKYHFIAWRKLANELGFDFTAEQNEKLKGISRMESLDLILSWGGVEKTAEERLALATKKNDLYLTYILKMGADEVLDGAQPFLRELQQLGLQIAIGSASKNATTILQQLGLAPAFNIIIDGNKVSKSKPDPEVFLRAAADLGLSPAECIVFEDAEAGIEAALAGGFYAVGIGDPAVLKDAHLVVPDFKGRSFKSMVEGIRLKKEIA